MKVTLRMINEAGQTFQYTKTTVLFDEARAKYNKDVRFNRVIKKAWLIFPDGTVQILKEIK